MPAEPPPASPPSASPFPGRALRILYADDMPELRDLMSDLLGREGHSIETVHDGDQALIRLKQPDGDFDVLITDHHMPGLDGLELVRQMRQLPYPGKILVFSSELSESVREEYRKFAVDAVLAKPVFPVALRALLARLFEVPAEPVTAKTPGLTKVTVY